MYISVESEVLCMRLQVNCSNEMVAQIDKYAKAMGVSRSALCSMFIGQGVMGFNKSYEMLEEVGKRVADNMLADKSVKALKNEADLSRERKPKAESGGGCE